MVSVRFVQGQHGVIGIQLVVVTLIVYRIGLELGSFFVGYARKCSIVSRSNQENRSFEQNAHAPRPFRHRHGNWGAFRTLVIHTSFSAFSTAFLPLGAPKSTAGHDVWPPGLRSKPAWAWRGRGRASVRPRNSANDREDPRDCNPMFKRLPAEVVRGPCPAHRV